MEVKIDADELCELRRAASRADRLHSDLVEISSKHNKLIASLGGHFNGGSHEEPWFMDRADHIKYVARSHKQICHLNDVIAELREENEKLKKENVSTGNRCHHQSLLMIDIKNKIASQLSRIR